MFIFLLISGLVGGSFIGAYTYRLPRNIPISRGRSFCPSCKQKIAWFDNIPLLSFFLLKGKCRQCKKKISFREPLIELIAGVIFVLLGYFAYNCSGILLSPICYWQQTVGHIFVPLFGILSLLFLAVLIIDLEHMIIPDELVSASFFLLFISAFVANSEQIYIRLFVGFAAATFLLFINLLTKGKGMGLGDVKLAIPAGFLLGIYAPIWFFLAFLLGAFVGVILIAFKKAEFGKKIPFGPFLILSLFLCLFWGHLITNVFFPNLLL